MLLIRYLFVHFIFLGGATDSNELMSVWEKGKRETNIVEYLWLHERWEVNIFELKSGMKAQRVRKDTEVRIWYTDDSFRPVDVNYFKLSSP